MRKSEKAASSSVEPRSTIQGTRFTESLAGPIIFLNVALFCLVMIHYEARLKRPPNLDFVQRKLGISLTPDSSRSNSSTAAYTWNVSGQRIGLTYVCRRAYLDFPITEERFCALQKAASAENLSDSWDDRDIARALDPLIHHVQRLPPAAGSRQLRPNRTLLALLNEHFKLRDFLPELFHAFVLAEWSDGDPTYGVSIFKDEPDAELRGKLAGLAGAVASLYDGIVVGMTPACAGYPKSNILPERVFAGGTRGITWVVHK